MLVNGLKGVSGVRQMTAATGACSASWLCTISVSMHRCLSSFFCLQGKNKRSFVQTFFLAVQEKGYFVLNDIFRYLPEAPAQSAPEPAAPSAASSQAPTENGSSPPTTTESSHQSYPQVS